MTTRTEKKFVSWFERSCQKQKVNYAMIKMPDFKQTGLMTSGRGLPDYLSIRSNRYVWFEVKMTMSKTRFAFDLMEQSQWQMFNKLIERGNAEIWIAAFMDNGKNLVFFKFEKLRDLYVSATEDVRSVTLEELSAVSYLLGDPSLQT